MITEALPPAVLTLGAAWTFWNSPREFPDVAFSIGLLVVVAAGILAEIVPTSLPINSLGYVGVALAAAAGIGFVDRFVAERRAA